MLNDNEKAAVESALELLSESASYDHDSCDPLCTIDLPQCELMRSRAAKRKLEAVLNPVIRSTRPLRLTNPAERIYFDYWAKQNIPSPGLNHGFTTLEWILCPEGQKYPDRPTQRDADVATAVIQWLGTSCGRGLVLECERLIKQQGAGHMEAEFGLNLNNCWPNGDVFDRLTDRILKNIVPSVKHNEGWTCSKYGLAHLRHEIYKVLAGMFALFAFETGQVGLQDAAGESEWSQKRFRSIHRIARKAVADRAARLAEKKKQKTA